MFIIKPDADGRLKPKELQNKLKIHMLYAATADVYYTTARMLNGHHKILDLETYNKYYKNFLNDIELETEPIDAFIPPATDEEGNATELFLVNRVGPEYEKIKNRVTFEDMKKYLPPTHEVVMKVTEDPSLMETVHDDIYIYWSMLKYFHQLDIIRIEDLSEFTPVIEMVVKNFDAAAIGRHLHGNKIDIQKYNKYIRDIVFKGDYAFTKSFYSEPHGDIPVIDVELLMQKLLTNVDCEPDVAIIVGIFMTLSFAMADIRNDKIEDSECAKYVRDVLAKI